jgi:superfamily I DNA/RNA helicase/RecB family exonuclease
MSTAAPIYRLVRPAVARPDPPSLDAAQQAVVDHAEGPLLVLAGPGTGKTTTIVEAVVERIRRGASPEQVLVLTFSRKAADELRARIAGRLGRTVTAPAASTFHSFCYSLLRVYGVAPGGRLPRLLSGGEREVRVRELLAGNAAGEGRTRWPAEFAPAIRLRGFASEVADLLDRARERGLDGRAVRRLGTDHDRPEWVAAGTFLDEYLDVLEIRGEVDYAGLVARADSLLDGPAREVRDRFSAVYVDEYQDTDPSQEHLLHRLAGAGRLLVAVGDPDQSIYRFRGAEVAGIVEFPDRFAHADGRPASVVTLSTCRRSGADLLAVSRAAAARIPMGRLSGRRDAHRGLTAAGPPADAPPEIRIYASVAAEVAGIADLLLRAHLLDAVPWSQMAVLVRSGRRSIPVVRRALVAAGVPVSVALDELPLSHDPAVAPLLQALRIVAEDQRRRAANDRAVATSFDASEAPEATAMSTVTALPAISAEVARSLLLSPLGGATSAQLRSLGRQLRQLDSAASGELPRRSDVLIGEVVADPRELTGLDDRVAAPVRRLTALLAEACRVAAAGGSPAEVLWALWDGSHWARRLSGTAGSDDTAGRAADRDLDAVVALFDAAARLEDQQPRATVAGLLEEIEAQEIPAAPYEERTGAPGSVRLLTAHRAKGLEWDLVVVAGIQEGVWPDLRRRGSLLDADGLDPEGPRPPPPASALLTDERRLFYVALTRARRRLVLTATSGSDDLAERPSRLLEETGLRIPEPLAAETDVLSLPSLVARLRRAASSPPRGDAADGDALRDAAASCLADLVLAVDAAGAPLVPAASPGRWWGLAPLTTGTTAVRPVDRPVDLSGSGVAAFSRCPRAWFLDREVKAIEATSTAQGFGSIVHALAEAVVVGDLPADLDEITARLDEVWDRLPYDARWQAARDHVEARAALVRFLDWHLANPRECAGAEVSFEVPVGDDIVLRGRADRIELDDAGRVVVVDLKTGKHPLTKDQLVTDPQLGIYQLASRQGAFAQWSSEPGGAELLQLRQDVRGSVRVQPQPALEPGDPWVDELVAGVAADIRAERFAARPNDGCDRCRFRTSCPARSDGSQVVP